MNTYLSNKLLSFIQSLKKNNIFINQFQVNLVCDSNHKDVNIKITGFAMDSKNSKSIIDEVCKKFGFIIDGFSKKISIFSGEIYETIGFSCTLKNTVALDTVYYITEDENTTKESDSSYENYVKDKYSSDIEKTGQDICEKKDRFELLDLK